MDQKIKNVVAGETPSLLDATKANELIDAINAFRTLQITPQGFGKVTLGEKNVVLDLNALKDIIDQLNTTVAGFSSQSSAGGGGGSGSGGSSTQAAAINKIILSLANPIFTIACDAGTGTITASLTFTNLPSPV